MDLIKAQHSKQEEPCLRATMPGFINRGNLRQVQEHEKKPLLLKNESSESKHLFFDQSCSFFVRTSKQSLVEQRRIYEWRLSCSDNLVGISAIKLQSGPNLYNPNALFKVDMSIKKSNFVQIKDLCLRKCIPLLKSTLQGVSNLLENFYPIIFSDKMIYLTQEGRIKVWIDERFYINQKNELYSQKKQVSIQQCLISIFEIFKCKCLPTKMSNKLFTNLSQVNEISEALEQIVNFEKTQCLFSINGLKVSVSTAVNNSTSIEFSANKPPKKIVKRNSKIEKTKNLSNSHKFFSTRSMQIKQPLNENEVEQTPSKYYKKSMEYKQEPHSAGLIHQQNSIKHCSSIVLSQTFDMDLQNLNIKSIIKPQQSQNDNTRSNLFMTPTSLRRARKLGPSLCEDEQRIDGAKLQSILQQNGWNSNFTSLFEHENMKQSFTEGKEQSLALQVKLKKLHTMGKQVRQSIMSDEFDV